MPIAKFRLPIFAALLLVSPVLAQESPSPTSSPTETPTPSPSPTATVSRNVRISFIPPPMEGTISLGIFDSNKKLVRILHREAKIDDFKIDETSLTTTWDGKGDAAEDLPPGKYHARGYLVGDLKVDEVNRSQALVSVDSSGPVAVKLVTNPLNADTRSVLELAAGTDRETAYLKTTDGLPLRTITHLNDLMADAALTQDNEKGLTFWVRQSGVTSEFRVTGASKMMAFDCGDFELK